MQHKTRFVSNTTPRRHIHSLERLHHQDQLGSQLSDISDISVLLSQKSFTLSQTSETNEEEKEEEHYGEDGGLKDADYDMTVFI